MPSPNSPPARSVQQLVEAYEGEPWQAMTLRLPAYPSVFFLFESKCTRSQSTQTRIGLSGAEAVGCIDVYEHVVRDLDECSLRQLFEQRTSAAIAA